MEIIKEGLKQTNNEKNDLESMRNQLSNLLLGDAQTPAGKEPPVSSVPSPALPEPPVVVHVKSATKTGS